MKRRAEAERASEPMLTDAEKQSLRQEAKETSAYLRKTFAQRRQQAKENSAFYKKAFAHLKPKK